VLVVDDDEFVRQVLDVRLRRAGLEPTFAFDAESALAEARMEPPRVLVLDMDLPNGNGVLVMDQMKRIERLAGVPIIVFSADEQARLDAVAAGADAFVEKAEGIERLLVEIEARLAQTSPH